ncbi:hypothetical protein [Vitreoscilla stercoraria]|uniref:Transmembrane protein n=1 Tax=Vitreoscilla stercoraria TaxID=61 RepID=A0ABY4EC00_VITST|nr:hypothetical protein [Vitreoscilla stercoraria]UOO93278.1 hypothetical protein LVJ81_04395 [Vitreoscilla stercoraria]
MTLDTNEATVIEFSWTHYFCLCWAVVILIAFSAIPAYMTAFHVGTVWMALIHGSWAVLLALFFLVFWSVLLFGCFYCFYIGILAAPRYVFLNTEGICVQTLYRPLSYHLAWENVAAIQVEVYASVTLHFYTGSKYLYVKEQYPIGEKQRDVYRKYKQTSSQMLVNRVKDYSKPQFEQLLMTYYRRRNQQPNSILVPKN